jgi:hypothetical protein
VAKLQDELNPVVADLTFIHAHCVIHQETVNMKYVLALMNKSVNFLFARGSNRYQFSYLFGDLGNGFERLP